MTAADIQSDAAWVRMLRGQSRVALAVGVIVLAAYLVHVGFYWQQINDDAFITFRFSRFLALGRGPYYNPGEHVEGYTNFLLMLLMAGVIRLLGPEHVLPVARVVGTVGGALAIWGASALCTRWVRKLDTLRPQAGWVGWLAGALVVVNAAYAFNTTSGLETTLFSGLVVLGLWLVQKGNDEDAWRGAGVAFALAALTRPEGAMVFAAAFAGRLVAAEGRRAAGRQRLIVDAVIVGVVVAGHVAFRVAAYDGELVPNTYYAKSGLAWTAAAVRYATAFLTANQAVIIPVLALLALAAGPGPVRRDVAPPLFVIVTAVAGVIATGPDWMLAYRLLTPYAPVWAALAICGALALSDRVRWKAAVVGPAAGVCLVVFFVAWHHAERVAYYRDATVNSRGYLNGHEALAEWLNEQTEPGATIALMDIGIVGYRCIDRRILDITGLTDRYIAKSPGPFLAKQYDPAYVFDRKPEYLVVAVRVPPGTIDPRRLRRVRPWTWIEGRLLQTEAFRRHYSRRRRPDPAAPALEQVAARVGAVRVFRHEHYVMNYLLLAFEYREGR